MLMSSEAFAPAYACLHARFALEALAYDLLQDYLYEVSADAMNGWTPRAVLKELLYTDPDACAPVNITIGWQPDRNTPRPRKSISGRATDFRVSGRIRCICPQQFPSRADNQAGDAGHSAPLPVAFIKLATAQSVGVRTVLWMNAALTASEWAQSLLGPLGVAGHPPMPALSHL